MYYGFMAFLAATYSKSIVVGFTLLQARTTVVTQLNNLLELTNLSRYEDIIKGMLIIAEQMLPASPAPRIHQDYHLVLRTYAVQS
jgi:MFS superfamily sulfate permease-like transporter